MKEKEIILIDKNKYKEITRQSGGVFLQILNIIIVLLILYILIRTKNPIWIIGPMILALTVLITLLKITIKNIDEFMKNSDRVTLRCYHWNAYKEGTNAIRVYSDHFVYVEIVANYITYAKFKEIYNTEKKIKNLVYKTFYTFIMYENER